MSAASPHVHFDEAAVAAATARLARQLDAETVLAGMPGIAARLLQAVNGPFALAMTREFNREEDPNHIAAAIANLLSNFVLTFADTCCDADPHARMIIVNRLMVMLGRALAQHCSEQASGQHERVAGQHGGHA